VAQCGYIWPQSLIRLRLSLAICISMAQVALLYHIKFPL
jgi:hypothetical protein